MGHRHLSNSLPVSEMDQDHCRSHRTAERAYIRMGTGRAVAAENGSVVCPMENTQTSGLHCVSYPNLEHTPVQHSISSSRLEGPHWRVPESGSSYERFPHSQAPGSFYQVSGNGAGHAHLSYNNLQTIHEVEDGLQDPLIGTGRGPSKRKRPNLSYERGSSSRFYTAGSSSGSFESQLEKSSSEYKHFTASSFGVPPYRDHPFGSDDSLRNVRTQSRIGLESTLGKTYLSNQTTHHNHTMNHVTNLSRTLDFASTSASANVDDQSHVIPAPAAHGRPLASDIVPENNGMSREMNQFLVGGSTIDTGHFHRDSVPTRNLVSPPQYLHGIHAQTLRDGHGNWSQRATSSFRPCPSFSRLGHEAARSENGLQFLSETCPSRFLSPSSDRGRHNNHRDRASRITIDRYESLSNTGDAHNRMQTEARTMVDRLSHGSRNLFDPHRAMRLDIDNMDYEELLALGERIGNVSTGLSENVISTCLKETIYSSSKFISKEARCAICLEEYKKDDKVGTLKNCKHDYHAGCIKKWLLMKNTCPICKGPALSDRLKEQSEHS